MLRPPSGRATVTHKTTSTTFTSSSTVGARAKPPTPWVPGVSHFSSACRILLTNSQLGRMLSSAWVSIYDLMKRTLNLYIIYSTRCSVDRLGWGFALNAYLLVSLFPLPHGPLRPSLLEPIRHDLLGLVTISLNIVIQSKHRCLWVERSECTSCVIGIIDHVEFGLGMTCRQS
jgi:hypothetical protein